MGFNSGLGNILHKISARIRLHPVWTTAVVLLVIVIEQIVTLPFGEINRLARSNPPTSAFIEQRRERVREEGGTQRILHTWIPIQDVPKDVVNAVVVAEDGTFWSHHGFDWYEFRESIERNLEEGKAARGASTITQQLVKNLFLTSSKNPLRKIKEWILTWWMEMKLKKSRILEIYLNMIEWGDGVYGVEAASWYHFGKSASELSREEAARLAAIIPNPRQYSADSDSRYVTHRTELILERMIARGL